MWQAVVLVLCSTRVYLGLVQPFLNKGSRPNHIPQQEPELADVIAGAWRDGAGSRLAMKRAETD